MGSRRIGLSRTKALLDGLKQDINLGYDTSLVGDANTKIDFEKDVINLETNGAPQIKISGSNGEVTFNESYTFPYVDGTNNQVLVTDGSGSLSWANQAGGGGGSVRTVGVDTDGDGTTDNTLDADEDLILKAGTNVTLSEAGGVVTFNSTATSPKVLMAHLTTTFDLTTVSTDEFLDVPFDNVLKTTFDSADFNTGSYTFTAPEEGFYFINCSLYHTSMDVTATQYQVRISSSAAWAVNGAIAFRNYFPAGATENTNYTHRLDRIAHLSGSDEIKITIRPIATAGDYGDLSSNASLTYLTIQKL